MTISTIFSTYFLKNQSFLKNVLVTLQDQDRTNDARNLNGFKKDVLPSCKKETKSKSIDMCHGCNKPKKDCFFAGKLQGHPKQTGFFEMSTTLLCVNSGKKSN